MDAGAMVFAEFERACATGARFRPTRKIRDGGERDVRVQGGRRLVVEPERPKDEA